MNAQTQETLPGVTTMRNALGQDVPVELVKEIDKLRDSLVMEVAAHYDEASKQVEDLRENARGDVQAFLDLSATRYGEDLGGKKGNVTLYSYDGRYKIQRCVSPVTYFDEGLSTAKDLIDQCLNEWTDGGRPELKLIIDKAFRPNNAGRVNQSAILNLRTLAINDEKWIRAMSAINDSLKTTNSKEVIRVYRKSGTDEWEPIRTDI